MIYYLGQYTCLKCRESFDTEDDDGELIECPFCDDIAVIDYGWDCYSYLDEDNETQYNDEEYRRLIKYDS